MGSQKSADALLKHFASLTALARATVEELLPFVSRSKALRLVSSLRMGTVALREERQSLTVDNPLAVADLCSEMRFLDRESLRVVLLDAKQHLIKIATVSQGTINESLAHPREIFKPVITHSAYSFILVHNHPSGDPSPSEANLRLTRRIIGPYIGGLLADNYGWLFHCPFWLLLVYSGNSKGIDRLFSIS